MSRVRTQMGQIDYPAILEEAWRQHLMPRESDAPIVISLFAGCGGSSLGYSMAGFHELLAVEWDNNAVETFRLNFPNVPVYHGDITKLSIDECLQMTELEPGQLDVLDGSPPCQGFSTAGKRVLDDPRNSLFQEYVRLLRGLRPRVFVMENVSGMVKGKMKLVFAEVMRELKASGYKVSCRLMNAMYFHVPQSRERLIWIGVRDDLGIEPSHPGIESGSISFLDMIVGLDEYCDRDLPDFLKEYIKIHPGGWNTNLRRYKMIKGNNAGAISLKWADWQKPLGTISKQEISSTGIIHPNKSRYLNLSEARRGGSFPDEFRFTDRKLGWARIGNSVPPLFMRAIARHIRSEILGQMTGMGLEAVDSND